MRRRFTLAIVGVVAGTLLVVGFGTLALLTIQGRREAKRNVVSLATHIATEEAAKTVPGIANLGRLLGQTKDLEIIRVDASGGACQMSQEMRTPPRATLSVSTERGW